MFELQAINNDALKVDTVKWLYSWCAQALSPCTRDRAAGVPRRWAHCVLERQGNWSKGRCSGVKSTWWGWCNSRNWKKTSKGPSSRRPLFTLARAPLSVPVASATTCGILWKPRRGQHSHSWELPPPPAAQFLPSLIFPKWQPWEETRREANLESNYFPLCRSPIAAILLSFPDLECISASARHRVAGGFVFYF